MFLAIELILYSKSVPSRMKIILKDPVEGSPQLLMAKEILREGKFEDQINES